MKSLEDYRQQLQVAELQLEIDRERLREQRRAIRSQSRRWAPWLTVAGGLLVGWAMGRPALRRTPRESRSWFSAFVPSRRAHHAAPLSPAPRPTAFGVASLLLAGSRAVPAVLPLALAWLDRRRAAQTPAGQGPTPMPLWLLALRAAAPLLRRR